MVLKVRKIVSLYANIRQSSDHSVHLPILISAYVINAIESVIAKLASFSHLDNLYI